MAQLWKGRFKKELAKETNDFNSSIKFDSRMFEEDIKGSIAHATMLGATGIIDKSESDKIVDGLDGILDDIKSGKLAIDMNAEDIHTFVEGELTARLGQTGKRLHTARSRNDQVALDIRMVLKKEIDEISEKIKGLIEVLCNKAEENKSVIMPGYTHLQRAQPITFGHHLMAYASMLLRDLDRLSDVKRRWLPSFWDLTAYHQTALTAYRTGTFALSLRLLFRLLWFICHVSAKKLLCGAAGNSNLLSLMMHFLQAQALCRKRKTPILQNL